MSFTKCPIIMSPLPLLLRVLSAFNTHLKSLVKLSKPLSLKAKIIRLKKGVKFISAYIVTRFGVSHIEIARYISTNQGGWLESALDWVATTIRMVVNRLRDFRLVSFTIVMMDKVFLKVHYQEKTRKKKYFHPFECLHFTLYIWRL